MASRHTSSLAYSCQPTHSQNPVNDVSLSFYRHSDQCRLNNREVLQLTFRLVSRFRVISLSQPSCQHPVTSIAFFQSTSAIDLKRTCVVPEGSGLGTFRITLVRLLHFYSVPNLSIRVLRPFTIHWHQPTATFRLDASTIFQPPKYTRRLRSEARSFGSSSLRSVAKHPLYTDATLGQSVP